MCLGFIGLPLNETFIFSGFSNRDYLQKRLESPWVVLRNKSNKKMLHAKQTQKYE